MTGMQPADIALTAVAGDVRLSPDGGRALYTLTTVDLGANRYRTRVWLADVGGGRPRPVTTGVERDVLPRWSPDGRMLAWVSSAGGGRPTILVQSVDGPGSPVPLVTWSDDVDELEWSPTGDRLAFVGRVPDVGRYGSADRTRAEADMPPRRVTRLLSQHNGDGWVFDRPPQVHVVALDGVSPPQQVTDVEAGGTGAAWSPDGSRLAYVAADHETWDLDGCNDLWVVDASGGPPTRLSASTMSWSRPSWSPEGDRIAALGVPDPAGGPRHGQLWIIDPGGGGATRWVADLDRNMAPYDATRSPVWVGDTVLSAVEDAGGLHVVAASATGHRVVLGGRRLVRSFDAASGAIAFVATSPTEPTEVWAGPLDGDARRLSDHGATLTSRVSLGDPERFVATSADGTEVECWAMPPVDVDPGRRHPTVLNIHGGPFSQYGYGFFDELQLQVGAGLGVVYCNPRGSSGYGEAWGRAIRWPEAAEDPGSGWGGVDYDDVMACVDEAVGRFDWVDAAHIGVQGGSYGGYLTSWIVGHTDRFSAAVSERAVNNLVTMEHNSDISGFFREYAGWSHLERPDILVRQSPATYVARMTTPMLLVHSEDDLRCPISQAEELFVALRLLGRRPELVRFPGEDHELSRSGSPRHRIMRAEIILEWLDRHLRPST